MPNERRQRPRVHRPPLAVRIREQDRFRWTPVECIDFNRHGMAITASHPLPEGRQLELALEALDVRVEGISAVVHNCRRLHGSWRCGLQFRPVAPRTREDLSAAESLSRLEERLQAGEPCVTPPRD